MTVEHNSLQKSDLQLALQNYYLSIQPTSLLKPIREKAWNHFLNLGLPEKKDYYQYIPLRQLYAETYSTSSPSPSSPPSLDPFIYPECQSSLLVFVNGRFTPELSRTTHLPSHVVILPLSRAMQTYGAFLTNRCNKILKEEKDPFALLNMALHPEGVFVYIPSKTKLPHPVQVLHFIDAQEPVLLFPRLHLFAGNHSEASFLSTTISSSSQVPYWVNSLQDFALEEGSQLHLTSLCLPSSSSSWHFESIRGHFKKHSSFQAIKMTTGSKTVRDDFHMTLAGENSQAILSGLSLLNKSNQAHTHIFMDHQAPYCHSKQHFKTVLDDFARCSFEGKIFVHPEAQKTDAFQLNNHLLLSDHAVANSKPNLEIFADDVKASHGATVGQLDEDHFFYLRSRGLSQEQARALLIQGFTKQMSDLIPIPSVRQEIERLI